MKKPKRVLRVLLGTLAAGAVAATIAAGASALTPATIYDAIPSPLPGNVVSLGFQATQTAEFGDEVTFAGTNRYVTEVKVVMSSWACQSGNWFTADCVSAPGATFSHPITLNLYNSTGGSTPGSLITSVTQTFAIPYRPSTDSVNCTGGRWFEASSGNCYNGFATTITFNVNAVVPNTVVYGIAFNTNTWGYNPIGAPGPYESLNVGLRDTTVDGPVTVGTDVDPDAVFWNTMTAANYTDGGAGGTGTFRKDTNWTPYTPAVSFTATEIPVGPPTNKDQCKKDGWKTFNNPPFKNQGDCIQFVNTGK